MPLSYHVDFVVLHWFSLVLESFVISFVLRLPNITKADGNLDDEHQLPVNVRNLRDLEQVRARPRLDVARDEVFYGFLVDVSPVESDIGTTVNRGASGVINAVRFGYSIN